MQAKLTAMYTGFLHCCVQCGHTAFEVGLSIRPSLVTG